MSKKRSKILLAMSILVISVFLLIQFMFQRTHLIPQLPASLVMMPFKGTEKSPSIGSEIDISDSLVKESDQQSISNQPSQGEEASIAHEEDKSTVHHPDQQSTIVIDQVNVSQILKNVFTEEQRPKPEESKVVPEEPKSVETKLDSKEFKVVLWTDFFQTKDYINDGWKSNCGHTNCLFTSDRSSYQQADALMFHSADINVSDLPNGPRSPQQRWIYLNHESPPHTKFQSVAALNGLVNWTVTYRLDSDVLLSPLFVPSPSVLPEIEIKHSRTGMVSWLVSNCVTASNRESFVEELKKHISVDVYGACGNLTCLPKMSNECYDSLASKYYFYLSFENSLCPDYVTEKFFSIMDYPIVPVVFGGADYSRVAPPNSYIDALSFDSPAKLAEYLIHLTRNPEEYDVYFKWKRYYLQTYTHYACHICSALNKPEQSTRRTWDHLSRWWFEEGTCKRWVNGKTIPWKSA